MSQNDYPKWIRALQASVMCQAFCAIENLILPDGRLDPSDGAWAEANRAGEWIFSGRRGHPFDYLEICQDLDFDYRAGQAYANRLKDYIQSGAGESRGRYKRLRATLALRAGGGLARPVPAGDDDNLESPARETATMSEKRDSRPMAAFSRPRTREASGDPGERLARRESEAGR